MRTAGHRDAEHLELDQRQRGEMENTATMITAAGHHPALPAIPR
jgi:hypothetical protein